MVAEIKNNTQRFKIMSYQLKFTTIKITDNRVET